MTPPSSAPSDWLAFIDRYRDQPVAFVTEVIGQEPDEWQRDVLQAIAAGKRRISVRSGHGVGKSTCAAWACIWYLTTRYPCKIAMTAPTSSQLWDALWAETRRWLRALPQWLQDLYDPKQERIELRAAPDESFITARTSRAEQPEALQGIHSEYVMLLVDEASGVPEKVFEAAAGSMSGHNAVTLLLGNPVRSTGLFYDTHHRLSFDWTTFHVSCLKSKRVAKDYVEDIARRYGIESNAYRIRVLGEFPLAEDDTIIPMESIESAIDRDITPDPWHREVWGMDVARFGSDSSAIVRRKGAVVLPPRVWSGLDTMQSTGILKTEYDAAVGANFAPLEILVDVIGLGSGVVDRSRELGLPVRGVNVGEAPAITSRYANLRSELWWACREWFLQRNARIPRDERLVQELAGVKYKFTSDGKIQVESKADMKKRGRRSPDVADALVLTFASTAATMMGMKYGRGPLKRGLPMV